MKAIELILRHSVRSQPERCARCPKAIEAGAGWEAFEQADVFSGPEVDRPICICCVASIDERVRIALDILNLGPSVRLRQGPDLGVPF